MPQDVRLAMPYYKPSKNKSSRTPDFYLHETDQWLVLPYELTGLSIDEIQTSKAWMMPILEQCKASPD
jgi:hypothetical protein